MTAVVALWFQRNGQQYLKKTFRRTCTRNSSGKADTNSRSLNQEALAHIQRSFDRDDRLGAETVNRPIEEAVDSGPQETLTRQPSEAARDKALERFTTKHRAA